MVLRLNGDGGPPGRILRYIKIHANICSYKVSLWKILVSAGMKAIFVIWTFSLTRVNHSISFHSGPPEQFP